MSPAAFYNTMKLLKSPNKERAVGIKAGSLQSKSVNHWIDEKLAGSLSSEFEVQCLKTLEAG